MRLVAVFIEDHNYDFGGYTLNFGGNFYYDLKFGDGRTRSIQSFFLIQQ